MLQSDTVKSLLDWGANGQRNRSSLRSECDLVSTRFWRTLGSLLFASDDPYPASPLSTHSRTFEP